MFVILLAIIFIIVLAFGGFFTHFLVTEIIPEEIELGKYTIMMMNIDDLRMWIRKMDDINDILGEEKAKKNEIFIEHKQKLEEKWTKIPLHLIKKAVETGNGRIANLENLNRLIKIWNEKGYDHIDSIDINELEKFRNADYNYVIDRTLYYIEMK